MQKPTLPKGTRDFLPSVLKRRNFIKSVVESAYQDFGFSAIETPAMENLSTLSGKYGEEGDKLLFKVLDSGDFMSGVDTNDLSSQKVLPKIASKGLRYDLTVPFSRFVVQNRNELTLPFKRYQMQQVWRADRPQKGRYREFWQLDADVIGTDAILCEAEFIQIYQRVFGTLGLAVEIQINHRKLLEGIIDSVGAHQMFKELTIALDKLDKIGLEGVSVEMEKLGLQNEQIQSILSFANLKEFNQQSIDELRGALPNSELLVKAFSDFEEILKLLGAEQLHNVKINTTLARGLDYYTGCIFEVVAKNAKYGSLSGGGRYDDLTAIFGWSGISGMGISFGLDRLYDVMEMENLFPEIAENENGVLICHLGEKGFYHGFQLANKWRAKGLSVTVYPEAKKMKKQMDYANKCGFKWVVIIGDEEVEKSVYSLKNLETGTQEQCASEAVCSAILS